MPVQDTIEVMEQLIGGKRVAFFGGSFDPPHLGHLAVARAAQQALALDSVLFAPVGAQPLKPEGSTAGFDDRLAMTRLAIAGQPGFAISLLDAPKPAAAPNYTIDTLFAARAELPADGVLFCLMGADSFFGMRRWHRGAEIPFVAPLIVASRPGQPLDDLRTALSPGLTMTPAPPSIHSEVTSSGLGIDVRYYLLQNPAGETALLYLLQGLHIEISASQIREQIHSTSDFSVAHPQLLSGSVLDYIRSHGLYR
jgi:nicotinate-nucleotide adenylyltransferase